MTVSERIDRALSRATCPWCGNDRETVFVRVGDELVCRSPHFPRHRMGPIPGGRNEDSTTTTRSVPDSTIPSWVSDLEIDRTFEDEC